MNSLKLKICGMRQPQNMRDVAALLPDYMGFIFYKKSPRYVGEDFKIATDFPTNIIRVGVFVNESTEEILRLSKAHNFNFLQLHGSETVQQCEELKGHNMQIIKVFSVDDSFDFELPKFYSAVADFFLFDTKGRHYGGNAETFNWRVLERYKQDVPFFLSGGLNPENIQAVDQLKDMNLYALDMNSGVEIEPGLKDTGKIKLVNRILKRH